jgi:polysaccharide pyruvyl transferase WcaK-like protein
LGLLIGLNTRLFGPSLFPAKVVSSFESALASLLLEIHERQGASFVFFPLYRNKLGGDEEALARILYHLPRGSLSVEVRRLSCVTLLLEQTGRCDAFIGARYHAVVAAIRTGIPVLGIDYGRKTLRLMTENGLGDFVLPVEEATGERLKRTWDCLCLRRDLLRRSLAVVNGRQQELALRHFDLIAKAMR